MKDIEISVEHYFHRFRNYYSIQRIHLVAKTKSAKFAVAQIPPGTKRFFKLKRIHTHSHTHIHIGLLLNGMNTPILFIPNETL
jgi:hypothetical protein